ESVVRLRRHIAHDARLHGRGRSAHQHAGADGALDQTPLQRRARRHPSWILVLNRDAKAGYSRDRVRTTSRMATLTMMASDSSMSMAAAALSSNAPPGTSTKLPCPLKGSGPTTNPSPKRPSGACTPPTILLASRWRSAPTM